MKETRILMGMPISVVIVDQEIDEPENVPSWKHFGGVPKNDSEYQASDAENRQPRERSAGANEADRVSRKEHSRVRRIINSVFDYFTYIDETFSTYKETSEIMKINRGELSIENASTDMKEIFRRAEATKHATNGYFDIINRAGIYDPSGIVKGWAIKNAASLITKEGFNNYYVDAGGDIQSAGLNTEGKPWSIGICNPFSQTEIIKVIYPQGKGVATSGTYIRGQHIYNPKNKTDLITDIVSLTVIGPDVHEADRFATAAFAMGKSGIEFIERLDGFEGYIIDKHGIATMTTGFDRFTHI